MGVYIKGITYGEALHMIAQDGKLVDTRDIIKIEVPHGKLYDEDVFAKAIVESGFGAEFVNKVTGILMNIPTVIEAEIE